MEAAGHVPIDAGAAGNVALEADRLARSGGAMPKVLRDFIKRATDPDQGPITYAEARDFYSNATRLSADEFNRLTPVIRRQVGQFTQVLGNALADAAAQAGKLPEYQQAMREYARASSLRQFGQDAGSFLVKRALPVGVGGYVVDQWLKR
jgi:hypothetical protein